MAKKYSQDIEEILAIDRGTVECLDGDSDSRPFLAKRERDDLVLPIDFPNISITACNDPGDGYVFISNIVMFPGPTRACYIMILENDGFPVFFRRMRRTAYDFKKQPNGMLSYLMGGTQHFFTMDNTYTVVDSFTSQNGYPIDVHEFQILPNGHVIFIADDPRIIDMSQYVEGGDTAATVVGNVLQELDQSKNLVFQWRTFDHLDFMDSNFDLTAKTL